jgi:hypothetical protein
MLSHFLLLSSFSSSSLFYFFFFFNREKIERWVEGIMRVPLTIATPFLPPFNPPIKVKILSRSGREKRWARSTAHFSLFIWLELICPFSKPELLI